MKLILHSAVCAVVLSAMIASHAYADANTMLFKKGQVWTGQYSCAYEGKSDFSFFVQDTTLTTMTAHFSRYTAKTGHHMVFPVTGQFARAGTDTFTLTADDWMLPDGKLTPISFSGKFSSDGNQTYSGSTNCRGSFTVTLGSSATQKESVLLTDTLNAEAQLQDYTKLASYVKARDYMLAKTKRWKKLKQENTEIQELFSKYPITPTYRERMKKLRAAKGYNLTVADIDAVRRDFNALLAENRAKVASTIESEELVLFNTLHIAQYNSPKTVRKAVEAIGGRYLTKTDQGDIRVEKYDMSAVLPEAPIGTAIYIKRDNALVLSGFFYVIQGFSLPGIPNKPVNDFVSRLEHRYGAYHVTDKNSWPHWIRDSGKTTLILETQGAALACIYENTELAALVTERNKRAAALKQQHRNSAF